MGTESESLAEPQLHSKFERKVNLVGIDDDMLYLHRSELGLLSVRVAVPKVWRGAASAVAKHWSSDGNTIERTCELTFDVEEALVGIPPSVPCLTLDVWGAVVSLLVEERIRARAVELVAAHANLQLPPSIRR